MKLHQLTIENIASIEKAVIDFNAAPLEGERLFLITGETGSGKSTIIDCLCLALYGNTPRMKAAKNAKYENARNNSEKADEMTTNTPKQLMRRGSVRASVELTFEDNAGIPYIATWEVHRANGKVDGKISGISRTLRTADGVVPAHHFTKYGDIDDHIVEIVGLNMNQFLRTVVLAQGKFSEFLNSDETEKSDLLEKMTGTEIYTQVGKKIHEVCQEKQSKCKILRGQMENINTMSDEQRAKISDEMGELQRNHETIDTQFKQATTMAQWLSRKGQIDKEIAEKGRLLEEKLAQVGSNEHQAQQSLLREWDTTADVRHQLKENGKAQSRIRDLEGQQPCLQEEFDGLCAALRAASAEIENKQKKADEMAVTIANEEPNKAMYESIGQIVALYGQWGEKKKNITDYASDLEKDEKRLPNARKAVEEAKGRSEEIEKSIKELKKQQEAYDILDISSRIDDLNRAYRALENLKDKHAAVAQTELSLNDLKRKQAEEKTKLEDFKATVGEKRVRRDEIQIQLERVTDWNQLLVQAQKSLHEGETCPVCGNTITRLLAPKAESELEEIRVQFKQADDALQQTLTQMQATEKLILDYENRIIEAGKELLKKQNERDSHLNDTVKLLDKCGKKADEMVDNAAIDTLIREIDGQVMTFNGELKKASDLTRAIQAAQQRFDEANRANHKVELQYNTLQESIKHQRELIQNCKTEAAELSARLDELLAMKDWQEYAGEGFIKQLQSAAAGYRDLVNSRQQLCQRIELRRAAIPAMLKTKESIKVLDDHGNTADQAPDDLEDRWRGFGNRYVQWSTQLGSAKENAALTKQALDVYCDSHPEMSMERLRELNSHTQEEIEGIKQAHLSLSGAISTMRGAIDTLTNQLEDLKGSKPDFSEENPERLEELIAQKQETLHTLTTQIADLKAKLTADEENARLVQNKAALLKEAESEFEQWNQFNMMLGSADGAKFRRIAQSYILGELLANANGYLHQFNNRYELEANPGSLIILVRDLVQGDLTSANTLSGGESFMVSLALALALSNMTGRVFSVDTVFIDEGFGSLSPNYLDNVMETLNRLYDMGGRRVGIISHVEMLKERVPTQIQVYRDPDNNTVSRVAVTN